MAAAASSITRVFEVHEINGVDPITASVDDAHTIFLSAHALMVLASNAFDNKTANREVLQAGFEGIKTLLQVGIDALDGGHEDLLRELRATRQ